MEHCSNSRFRTRIRFESARSVSCASGVLPHRTTLQPIQSSCRKSSGLRRYREFTAVGRFCGISPYSICRSRHQSPDLNSKAIYFRTVSQLFKPIRTFACQELHTLKIASEKRWPVPPAGGTLQFGTDRLGTSTQKPRSRVGDCNDRIRCTRMSGQTTSWFKIPGAHQCLDGAVPFFRHALTHLRVHLGITWLPCC
jgi:hypothetical protein